MVVVWFFRFCPFARTRGFLVRTSSSSSSETHAVPTRGHICPSFLCLSVGFTPLRRSGRRREQTSFGCLNSEKHVCRFRASEAKLPTETAHSRTRHRVTDVCSAFKVVRARQSAVPTLTLSRCETWNNIKSGEIQQCVRPQFDTYPFQKGDV